MPGEYLPPVVTRLTGDIDDLIRKVEEAKAAIKSLSGTSVKIGFDIDQASLARAKAAATAAFGTGITVPVNFDVNTGGAAARAFAGRAGFGALGWAMGLAGRGVNLFGGVLPGILGAVGGIHLLIDGIAEVLAVVLPATIALAAFGIAASDAVKNIINQFTAIHTVMDATGQAIPPMTDAMEKLHQAVQPQVYSMLGDALTVMNNKAGEFAVVAKGAADALSYFAARTTVALTSSGLSQFMQNAVKDLSGLFNVFGNIAGTIGAVLKNLPGYAEVFLNVLQTVTHAVEVFANSGIGQGVIKFGLAFHGAFIYLGLLGTAVARIVPMILGWVVKLADAAGATALRLGFVKLADALGGVAGGAEAAAAGPWGWIALVAVGVGILAYKIITAKDATQQWLSTLQQGIGNQLAGGSGLAALMDAQVQVTSRLASAQVTLAKGGGNVSESYRALAQNMGRGNQVMVAAAQQGHDLTSGQKQLSDETNLYNYRLGALAAKYGGVRQASELLSQAGVKMSQMLDKSRQAWLIIQQAVSGVVQGYAAMAQRGGALGADLYVITQQATDQYQAVDKLNTAWQTFIGLTTGAANANITVLQTIRTMNGEMQKAHATFTGVNAASLILQGSFEQQLVPQTENVIGAMNHAHTSAQTMGEYIAGAFVKAVNDGALANSGMRTQIYDMARQAGYAGPNALAPLKMWIDRNSVSAGRMQQIIALLNKTLGQIPHKENLSIYVHAGGQWVAPKGMAVHPGFAAGGRIPGFGGGDHVPILAEPGEAIVDKYRARRYAGTLAAMGVKGFAGGGIIPSYSGAPGGLGSWVVHDYNATVNMTAAAVAKGLQSAMSSASMLHPTGSGGSVEALMKSMAASIGWTGALWNDLYNVEMREAGFNLGARNASSGAYGLAQFINGPSEYAQYGGNLSAAGQITAMFNYIKQRYGSPAGAWAHEMGFGWYDQGGYLPKGLSLALNTTGSPEPVGGGEAIEIRLYLDGREITRGVRTEVLRHNRRNGGRGSTKWDKPA